MNISEFVVGLGLDSEGFTKGMTSAIGQMGSFKSTVLQAGAAVAGTFSVKALTIDFAKQNDQLRQMAQYLGVSSSGLYGLSQAAKTFGADISEMSGLMTGFAQAKAGISVGEIGIFQDLAKAGIAIDPLIGAKNAGDMVIKLAEQFERLSQTQRVNVAKILGISPQMFDLLAKGRGNLEELSKKFEKIRPHTGAMEENSRRLNAQLVLLEGNVGGVADKIGNVLTNKLGVVVSETNAWFDANRDVINSGMDSFCKGLAENIDAVVIAVGGIAAAGTIATIGQLAKGLGSAGAAAGALATGVSKLVAPLAIAAALWNTDPSSIFGEGIGKFLKMTPKEFYEHFFGDDSKTPAEIERERLYDKIGDAATMGEGEVDVSSFQAPAIEPVASAESGLTPDKPVTYETANRDVTTPKKDTAVSVHTNVYIGNERIRNIARTESKAVVSEVLDNAISRGLQAGDH